MEGIKPKKAIERLSLNEIFVADQDINWPSIYRAFVDGRDMGKFKSSGMIVATGTGSSGWLYSAKQVKDNNIKRVQELLGIEDQTDEVRFTIHNIA